jgi:hypothetical protein
MKRIVLVFSALFLLSGISYSAVSNNGLAKKSHSLDVKVKKPAPVFLGSYTYGGVEYNFEGASTGKKVITGVFYISGGAAVYLSASDFSGTWAAPGTPGAVSFVTATVNSPTGLFSISQDIY